MKLVIDRIENNIVYAENEECETVKLEIKNIFGRVREGAVLIGDGDCYEVSEDETQARKAYMHDRIKRMMGR